MSDHRKIDKDELARAIVEIAYETAQGWTGDPPSSDGSGPSVYIDGDLFGRDVVEKLIARFGNLYGDK